jgi:diguanylate cyclase (GGDEF)-like protein/PAS domain S-box-containing protein
LKQPLHRRFSIPSHKRSLWALPAFGLLLIAAQWTGTWLQLGSTERALIGAETHNTENIVGLFERSTLRVIKDADRVTRLVKHEFERHGELDLPALIRTGQFDDSGMVVVTVADAHGNIIARSQPAAAFNVMDRDYFRLHAEHDSGSLDISKPVVGRVSGQPTILLSRRMNHRDGSFAGAVWVVVTPQYFMQFYDDSDLGRQGSLGLLGLDGFFRARRVGGAATTVSDGSESELMALAEANPAGHYEERSSLDHVRRIVAYRKLADYPFIVTAAQSTDEALSDFYQNRSIYLVIAAVATVVILLFFAVITILAMRLSRHRAELRSQRRFLENLVDNLPAGIAVRSMRPNTYGQYVLWNETSAVTFGITSADALGKTMQEVVPMANVTQVAELDRQLLASPMVQDILQVRDLPGKGRRLFRLIRAPLFDGEGRVEYIVTSAMDITEEHARTDELRLASKVFETTADAIVVSDADDRVVMVNEAFSKLTGYDAQDIVGQILAESPFRPVDPAESAARMERQKRDGFVTAEVSRCRKDGSPLSLWVTASFVRNDDGTIRNFVRVFTDISLLKETQQKLEQLASFDALTGLPNRRLVHDRLEHALMRAERHQVSMALMFIDLDDFKKVNDSLGHDVGDQLLREVAVRLATCIRASDTIGRIGGDEFVIVLEDACLPVDAVRVCQRIEVALAAPFDLDGHRLPTKASVGIAIFPTDGTDAATLLRNADAAMYQAKRTASGRFQFYSDVNAQNEPVAAAN